MNKDTMRALMLDALYQILDNKVFRLLVILTGIPILASFLIGFQEDQIVLLFGLESYEYGPILSLFGIQPMEGAALRVQAIQAIQSWLVEGLSGNFGILACIAATAFFVPRMLERGTADTLFSKPLSRMSLLMARYFAGVLFVFLLISALVLGVHAGLSLVSGYSDPGFLWGALTLTYVFALVHSFSTCVATLTRSSTAAILCTIAFFGITGCTHNIWIIKEHAIESEFAKQSDGTDSGSPEESASAALDDAHPMVRVMIGILDVSHYTLPKLTDADALTSLLRKSIGGDPRYLADETGGLTLLSALDFGDEFAVKENRKYEDDGKRFDLSWSVVDSSDQEIALIQLERFHRRHETLPDGGKGAKLKKGYTSFSHAKNLLKELRKRDDVTESTSFKSRVAERTASYVRWREWSQTGKEHREQILFGFGEFSYVITSTWNESLLSSEQREPAMDSFLGGMEFPALEETLTADNGAWLESRLSFSAPLKFNIFFSIGSSIAFAFTMLFISWLALRRINF